MRCEYRILYVLIFFVYFNISHSWGCNLRMRRFRATVSAQSIMASCYRAFARVSRRNIKKRIGIFVNLNWGWQIAKRTRCKVNALLISSSMVTTKWNTNGESIVLRFVCFIAMYDERFEMINDVWYILLFSLRA